MGSAPLGLGRGLKGSRQLWAVLAVAGLLGILVATLRNSSSSFRAQQLAHAAQPHTKPPAFTRELVADTPWHQNASTQLQHWRSDLLPRMLRAYTALEKAEYGTPEGEKKPIKRLEPKGHSRYDLFDPFVSCPGGQLKRVGKGRSDGDGGKWLCTEEEMLGPRPGSGSSSGGAGPDADGAAAGRGAAAGTSAGQAGDTSSCVIYSIGSRGQYEFEDAMLAATSCVVHTFDCNWKGKSIRPGRHVYHNTCLGDKTEKRSNGAQYMTLQDITAELGHPVIHLLKMDIEGFEYEVVGGLGFADSCSFPLQLSMEVHYSSLYHLTSFKGDRKVWDHMLWPLHELALGELALFFHHLADLGYAIVSREDNPLHWCCAEFTFVRVERPAHCGSSGGHLQPQQAAAAAAGQRRLLSGGGVGRT